MYSILLMVNRVEQRTKVCRYNWHIANSLGWPFPLQIKYTEAILIIIKQHSKTVMVRNHQNADRSLKKLICCVIYCNFRHSFLHYAGVK